MNGKVHQVIVNAGERGRNRTYNLVIKSHLLCQLSYAPVRGGMDGKRMLPTATIAFLPSESGVPANGFDGKSGYTNGEIFGAFRSGRAVANPFAPMRNYRLSSHHFDQSFFEFDSQYALCHHCKFIEVRCLPGFFPPARTLHARYADIPGPGIHPSYKFID